MSTDRSPGIGDAVAVSVWAYGEPSGWVKTWGVVMGERTGPEGWRLQVRLLCGATVVVAADRCDLVGEGTFAPGQEKAQSEGPDGAGLVREAEESWGRSPPSGCAESKRACPAGRKSGRRFESGARLVGEQGSRERKRRCEMLVVSRKRKEEIYIDVQPGFAGRLTVKVVDFIGGRARIGVSAPPEVRVLRREVAERIAAESTNEDDATNPDDTKPAGATPAVQKDVQHGPDEIDAGIPEEPGRRPDRGGL